MKFRVFAIIYNITKLRLLIKNCNPLFCFILFHEYLYLHMPVSNFTLNSQTNVGQVMYIYKKKLQSIAEVHSNVIDYKFKKYPSLFNWNIKCPCSIFYLYLFFWYTSFILLHNVL